MNTKEFVSMIKDECVSMRKTEGPHAIEGSRTNRYARQLVRATLGLSVVAICLATSAGCGKTSTSGDSNADVDAAPTKPTVHLPAPFDTLRLGASEAELKEAFPPAEDISNCVPHLVGGDAPMPVRLPGYEKKPRSYCARSYHIGGITAGEDDNVDSWMENNKDFLRRNSSIDRDDVRMGRLYAIAQIRGILRSGSIDETSVIVAAQGKVSTAYESVHEVGQELSWGGKEFSTAHVSRRQVCALMADECDDLDPDRVRTYVFGGYSLGQIDVDANVRVANSKCRNPYMKAEKRFAYKLSARAGAFPGIGLARATSKDRTLDPEDSGTYKVFSSRSKLEPKVAKFGVQLANGIEKAEEFWKGAIAVLPASTPDATWGSAVVWLTDGRISRILVNVRADDKLGDLPKELAEVYGSAGVTQGSVTKWEIPGGVTATLDIGAAASLVVE